MRFCADCFLRISCILKEIIHFSHKLTIHKMDCSFVGNRYLPLIFYAPRSFTVVFLQFSHLLYELHIGDCYTAHPL